MIKIKRAYESVSDDDGYRVLVDRIWPRGISKEKAAINEWLKEVAPSNKLRKWFGHDPAKYADFHEQYLKELNDGSQQEAFERLCELNREQDQLTLVYGAKDQEHNQAVVLKERLEQIND
ncbi:DUF488 domain-containing protein [Candidatus Enterococcus ferrettii]|uniref:DUF488 domain-containing protein n=1 Tax=Candidatus Enterococcus ferrettii TaxID=2815324 RepID=A0ABV0EZ26_9ENTE|nr:DUF488 domain-containing protein [Enterococcus sp. 665A]MBO1339947.1 DUF488 domain-containing protein [Enterococcus sp. 665A]